MSNNTIIRVDGLSKHYLLNKNKSQQSDTLFGSFVNGLKNIKNITQKKETDDFWALKDISFEVKQGDRVGIIGRNGAGKSTLLKILSRITPPTKGRVEITGRVASLLEVGTGFHGDLSGRENIYLNGSILGMSKFEIDKKFDEIVAFAEIDRFLDTPVKRYSSGMYVRLAFAVAAHLETDILILDEVLAVGDAAFQKKCIAKMNSLSLSEGKTLLFVSHSMSSIRNLCNCGVYLEHGQLVLAGPIDDVIVNYQSYVRDNLAKGLVVDVKALSNSGEWEVGTDLVINISWEKGKYLPGWHCDIVGYTFDGIKVFALQSHLFTEFTSDNDNYNGIEFQVRNIGFINSDLRLDVGIRKNENEPYDLVIENIVSISPSNKNLPIFARNDVITVPTATCKALKI